MKRSLPNPDNVVQSSILDFPIEILWIIASTLEGGDISTLARTHSTFYPKLRLALIKYNIRHQNSSALHWAAKNNNRAFAKTLLSYQADVNALHDGFSPLMTAAKYSSELITNLLLRKKNLHVNRRNADGESALWYSVAKESSAVVNQLLQHPRTKIDLLNREGQTVLWLTVFRGNRDLVSLLLSRGANPNTMDRYGMSPWIQSYVRRGESIKYLLLDHMKAVSPEIFSVDGVFAENGKSICEDSSSYGQSQVQLRAKRVRYAHV
jgi:ankyrin repeat protein